MYLMINGNRYTVSKRIVKPDEIRYLSVTPAPEDVSGVIQMYEGSVELPEEVEPIEEITEIEVLDDSELVDGETPEDEIPEEETEKGDFLISEDDADSFLRWTYSGTLLILTNVPEPEEPIAPVDQEPTTEEILNAMLGVTY